MVNTSAISETEARILEAATRIFRAKGRDGAKMQDIADEAGINKALLHYYFRSKDKLFEQVFRDSSAIFFSRLNEILQADLELFTKIRRLCDAYITMTMENPFIPIFIIGEVNRNAESFITNIFSGNSIKPEFKSLKKQIAEEIRSGRIRPVRAEELLMNILGLCIFPIIAKPMMQHNMSLSDKEFNRIMDDRKKTIPAMIIDSIKKKNT